MAIGRDGYWEWATLDWSRNEIETGSHVSGYQIRCLHFRIWHLVHWYSNDPSITLRQWAS